MYKGNGDIQPLVRNFGNGWNSAPVTLPPGKVSLDALSIGLVVPRACVEAFEKRQVTHIWRDLNPKSSLHRTRYPGYQSLKIALKLNQYEFLP